MKELPITEYNGKWYFIDSRLRQFRSVVAPIEFVSFDSELGRKIDEMPEPKEDLDSMERQITIKCPICEKILFQGAKDYIRHCRKYCTDCSAKSY